MNRTLKLIIITGGAGFLIWLAFGFFGIQALLFDREVSQEIPEEVSILISESNDELSESISKRENPKLLGRGSFRQGDSTYSIAGNVFLTEVNGARSITLTDFEVSNGPDLYVYAVKTDSTDNKTVKSTVANEAFIRLGKLKGNIGNQSYTLESDLDLSDYGVISIWCQRFSRNFGSALLTSQ